ncbi:glycoside hydrolase superfamily [Absidia repens]|uniref:Beta-hexosaminidase n=1 Tax=Absidia repens TaxID=90262 RepID=A0A1X2J044_9FUNG|nr:glycoside hydrolase superfamily [Absidia repens]
MYFINTLSSALIVISAVWTTSVIGVEQVSINSLPAVNPVKQPWIWPLPQHWDRGQKTLDASHIGFDYSHHNSILSKAIKRYTDDIFYLKDDYPMVPYNWSTTDSKITGQLRTVKIILDNADDTKLDLDTDESYELTIPSGNKARATLKAKNVYGALHGLETLSQIIQWSPENRRHLIPNAPWSIKDKPKYAYRGLLMDTSRHYYPLEDIKKTIETMAWNKMNAFHWHMLDSTSFPYESKAYPELSKKGAYSPKHVYSAEDLAEIVQFAKERGVRVIPEIEAPGHSTSWGYGIPEIVSCRDKVPYFGYTVQPPSGQLNIASNKTKEVVHAIVDEFVDIFPDSFFHASGDEVVYDCWSNDTEIAKYLKDNDMTVQELFSDFVLEMQDYIRSKNRTVIAWQESVLEYNLTLPKNTVIQTWDGSDGVKGATEKGYRTIVSSNNYWYLDVGFGKPRSNPYPDVAGAGFNHWNRMYSYDMRANLTSSEIELIIGGEAAVFGELIDHTNFESRIWPRASTVAHVLWSGYENPEGEKLTSEDAILRLFPWRERMLLRGTMASPLNQGFCTRNPLDCFQPPE